MFQNLAYHDAKIEGRAEGIAIGKNEGRSEGIKEIAKKLLELGVSLDIIIKSTGLSAEEIEKLKEN